jgi:hypothetical protein
VNDPILKREVTWNIVRIETIINSGIFEPALSSHPLCQSAFTELMICLHDLLKKCKDANVPVIFTDKVDITPRIRNVTDLVYQVRNAVCHTTSKHHEVSHAGRTLIFTFNVSYKKGTWMNFGEIEIKSDFDDDVCFFFGTLRIYLKRHIIRALEEAKRNLFPLIS